MQIDHVQDLSNRLSKVLDVDQAKILATLLKAKVSHSVLPVVIERDIDLDTASKFYDQKLFLPGIDILPDISRNYTQGEITADVLGYCGQITQGQLKIRPERRMATWSVKTASNACTTTNCAAPTENKRVRVNASGQALSRETAHPRSPVRLKVGNRSSLPSTWMLSGPHTKRWRSLGRGCGVRPQGPAKNSCYGVRARALIPMSLPKITPQVWKALNAPNHPLFNRALSGFPPGSTWKAITILAALENKVAETGHENPRLRRNFAQATSSSTIGQRHQGCSTWSKCSSLVRDSAFYQMALHMTPEMMREAGIKFGAGPPHRRRAAPRKHRLGAGLEMERTGLSRKVVPGKYIGTRPSDRHTCRSHPRRWRVCIRGWECGAGAGFAPGDQKLETVRIPTPKPEH